jgi:DNA-binding GntR family transcriptional regulator
MTMATPQAATSPMAPDIQPIENVPLRVQVADRLRHAILNGRLKPGTNLVETALAEQMNVSRAPIREAIQILENDGLVETIAYKGKRVKPLTAREVGETYSLREVFEVMAVRRILENGAPIDDLGAHCDEMTAAAQADNFAALVAADEAFHHALIRLADHDLLLASWKNLYLRIHQIMALRNRDERNLSEIASNHPPIVDAIAAGDADRAIKLISDHTRILAAFDPATIVEAL